MPRLLFVASFAFALPASAVPTEVAWQGRLLDATGTPVTGSHAVRLRLWSDVNSTNEASHLRYSEDLTLSFDDGYASAVLGASGGLDTDDFDGDVWLGITVDPPTTELGPRLPVTGNPTGGIATFQVPNDASTCNGSTSNAGTLRWTGTSLDVCVGLGGWKRLAASGATHRYWRSYKTNSAVSAGYHCELEVYSGATRVPVASNMLTQFDINSWNPGNLVDGSVSSTGFHTDTADAGAFVQIDFGVGNEQYLTEWRYYSCFNPVATWSIQYSDNGATWTTVASNFAIQSPEGWRVVTW
jgi:hypothetical protein